MGSPTDTKVYGALPLSVPRGLNASGWGRPYRAEIRKSGPCRLLRSCSRV